VKPGNALLAAVAVVRTMNGVQHNATMTRTERRRRRRGRRSREMAVTAKEYRDGFDVLL
jgi:hypothetical protein